MMLKEFDASSFAENLNRDKDGILIDVRTPVEFKKGHLPHSLLIDIYNPAFTEEVKKLDREKNYYIYCRSGSRSFHAGKYMLSIGFKNVSHLKPGIIGWYGPIEKSSSNWFYVLGGCPTIRKWLKNVAFLANIQTIF